MRTKGAYLLARLGLADKEVASRIGVTRPLISYWKSGTHRPPQERREQLFEAFGIPPDSWSEDLPDTMPVEVLQSSPQPAPAAPSQVGLSSRDVGLRALAMASEVDGLIARMQTDTAATPEEKAKVLSRCSTILGHLGKITGQGSEFPETKILATPAWARIRDAICSALDPYPEARRDVIDALAKL